MMLDLDVDVSAGMGEETAAQQGTLARLVQVLQARDPATTEHSRRVRHYALLLAEARGLEPEACRLVGLAAELHDLGKVGVPAALLHKPGPLSAGEYQLVQRHCILGERLLTPLVPEPEVLAAIRGHHERLDGSGYPDGLAGSRIPWLPRLIAVADCFDALTSTRPYRPALTVPEAFAVLLHQAGRQLDGDLVHTFVALAARRRLPELTP